MDELEAWANWLNDLDTEWWPFVFLRPEPYERMTTARVALLAVLYGGFAGTFADAMIALSGKAGALNPWLFPVSVTAIVFVVYRCTFAYFWNRRAARLTSKLS